MKNLEIAKILYEIADMLEIKGVEFKDIKDDYDRFINY